MLQTTSVRVQEGRPALHGARLNMAWLRGLLMVLGAAAILLGGYRYWVGSEAGFSTEDAYVRAAKVAIATDVTGIVSTIAVHDGQAVKRGQLLFRLDPAPFQHAVASAQAALDGVALTVEADRRDYQRMLRDLAARQAQLQSDEADLARFEGLVKSGGVTRAEYDQAKYRLAEDRQMVASLQMRAQVQLSKLDNNPAVDARDTPAYRDAEAKLAELQRQLAHTEIHAPFDGVVVNVSSLQPGQILPAATTAFGLVSTTDVWIEAFPKETQLTWARAGDPVRVTVDTYPDRSWNGVLESLSPASDASFALLPPQNASGNWVKIVQRIPVRARIEMHKGDPVLRDGMSVTLDVITGHPRTWRDLL